jgi:site-specific DNA-methyltransferase (adenine-specific)
MHYSQGMELAKLTKAELMLQCEQQGITNYKSKSKDALIKLLEHKASIEKSIDNKTIAKSSDNPNPSISVENMCGLEYLKTLDPNSIDLILTDPPYIISKSSGLDKHYNNVKYNEANDINEVKSEEEWTNYKLQNAIEDDTHKSNYIKYGSIYGKKYCVKTDYGSWDSDFSLAILEKFIELYYSKLKKGGTLIMFFDLWKITNLKDLLEKYNFKQLRFIEWIKTNPQPRNSKVNYLTNTREIALLGVKDSNPTFNSTYDNGIYSFPLQGGKNRFHPTQKSLALFEELIKKHSNEGDTILDTFLGSGTTALACKNTKRLFKGCEIDKTYYDKIVTLLQLQ